jgi:hypothetical protein
MAILTFYLSRDLMLSPYWMGLELSPEPLVRLAMLGTLLGVSLLFSFVLIYAAIACALASREIEPLPRGSLRIR